MRPQGRGELESLYFAYPQFDAPMPRADLDGAQRVVIVGAGPIGLTAALTLAKYGIASVVIERKSTFNDGSRAICISRSSFHILNSIGAVKPFLDHALAWTTGRTFYRGQQILEFNMPDGADERFRPMYNLQQQYIEQYLWQAADTSDLIDIRWQSEVTAISQTPDKAMVEIRDPNGTYAIESDWVLAADGARSAVRSMMGLRLKGENYEGRYVIADVQMDHDYPTIRRALFDPECRPGGTVLVHRQPDNIWRIDYQLRDGESAEEATQEDNVRQSVAGVLKDIGHTGDWDLEWWSVYSANTLALDDYRAGRVFFIGDSAHIVPIFGVRGLNNGLADGQNIGWKLAWVLNGHADEALLNSYSPERRGATMDVFANATKSTRFMTPPTKGWTVMRDAALSLALSHPFAGQLANPRQMSPYTYADSPAVIGGDQVGTVAIGAMVPDTPIDDGFLSEKLGHGFVVLAFGQVPSWAKDVNGAEVIVLPAKGRAAEVFGAGEGSAFLIRPDMHLTAAWDAPDLGAIQAALNVATGRGI